MKWKLFCLGAIGLSTTLFSGITPTGDKKEAQPSKGGEQSVSQQDKSMIKPQADKTDIFAIPVDTSETEEKQEMKSLKKLEQYEQEKQQETAKEKPADQAKL